MAHLALKLPDARVLHHMLFQLVRHEELHIADVALVTPFHKMVPFRVDSQRRFGSERFITRLTFQGHRLNAVHYRQMLLLRAIVLKLLVTVPASIQHVRVDVNGLLVRLLPPEGRVNLRTKVAIERASLVTLRVTQENVPVNETRVANVTHIVPVMRIHVFLQRFEFIENCRTNDTSEQFVGKFEGHYVILDVGEHVLFVDVY